MPGPMCFVVGCLAQVAVIFTNGLLIWAATLIFGERERGFRVALKTSLLEIIILYIINGVFCSIIFVRTLIANMNDWGFIDPLLPANGSLRPLLRLSFLLDIINLILLFGILTFLIKTFYKFETRRALKATGLVVLFDLMFGVSTWFFILVIGYLSGYWWM